MIFRRAVDDDDLSGLDDLYARFGPTIYARCRRMLRDPAAAQDATQETFLRIHDHLHAIRGPREALSWLYRTATNHCINELRNGRRRAAALATPATATATLLGPHHEARLSDQEVVSRILRELPEDLAVPAWLYHVDGLEQSEIAEICKVSRRTVIARIGRFTEAARAFIEKEQA
jgi:RNA polymerase sigma-70 factor, ECF subfamily